MRRQPAEIATLDQAAVSVWIKFSRDRDHLWCDVDCDGLETKLPSKARRPPGSTAKVDGLRSCYVALKECRQIAKRQLVSVGKLEPRVSIRSYGIVTAIRKAHTQLRFCV